MKYLRGKIVWVTWLQSSLSLVYLESLQKALMHVQVQAMLGRPFSGIHFTKCTNNVLVFVWNFWNYSQITLPLHSITWDTYNTGQPLSAVACGYSWLTYVQVLEVQLAAQPMLGDLYHRHLCEPGNIFDALCWYQLLLWRHHPICTKDRQILALFSLGSLQCSGCHGMSTVAFGAESHTWDQLYGCGGFIGEISRAPHSCWNSHVGSAVQLVRHQRD